MIKFSNQVPSIYPSASRDFQYIGWLVDIVLNSVKHNVDDLYQLPNLPTDVKITELLAMTLGFKIKRNYDQKQLAALVSILPSILKYKGTEKAVTMAAEALIKASGSAGSFDYEVSGAHMEVWLPEELVDTTLFTDLLEYILPAGMTCRVVRKTKIQRTVDKLILNQRDEVKYRVVRDLDWDETNMSTGMSGLYITEGKDGYEFVANFDDNGVNSGLMSNTVIPILSTRVPSGFNEEYYYNMITYDGLLLEGADGNILLGAEGTESGECKYDKEED